MAERRCLILDAIRCNFIQKERAQVLPRLVTPYMKVFSAKGVAPTKSPLK